MQTGCRKLCQDSLINYSSRGIYTVDESEVLTITLYLGTIYLLIVYLLAALTNLGYEFSQSGVAEQQPASGSDAVGLVLKLLWFKITEVTETVEEI